jgi:hypothetical protein
MDAVIQQFTSPDVAWTVRGRPRHPFIAELPTAPATGAHDSVESGRCAGETRELARTRTGLD